MAYQEYKGKWDEFKARLHSCSSSDKQYIKDTIVDRVRNKGTPQIVGSVVKIAIYDSRNDCRER